MTISRIRINLLAILIPLFIILGVGGYFSSISWLDYINDVKLQQQIEKIKLLQSLEKSVSEEIICVSKMSGQRENLQESCKSSRVATDIIVKQLSEATSTQSITEMVDEFFKSDSNETDVADGDIEIVDEDVDVDVDVDIDKEEVDEEDSIEKSIFFGDNLKNAIQDIRYSIDSVEDIKLVMLLEGEYYNSIIKPINKYWQSLDSYVAQEDK